MNKQTPPWDSSDPDEYEDFPPVDQKIAQNPTLSPAPVSTTRPGDRLHTVSGYIHARTEKAIRIEVYEVDGKPIPEPDRPYQRFHWFPISQIATIHTTPATKSGEEYDYIRVKEWLCVEKDLI